MANRKRWYAEVAGTFLLWVEEVNDNPPWAGHVLRRPWQVAFDTPDGPVMHTTQPWQDSFVARDEAIAKDAAVLTVKNCFPDWAHRLDPVSWVPSAMSNDEWHQRVRSFIERG